MKPLAHLHADGREFILHLDTDVIARKILPQDEFASVRMQVRESFISGTWQHPLAGCPQRAHGAWASA